MASIFAIMEIIGCQRRSAGLVQLWCMQPHLVEQVPAIYEGQTMAGEPFLPKFVPKPPETNQFLAPAWLRKIVDALAAIAHEQQDVGKWSSAMSHRGKKGRRTTEKDCVELLAPRLDVRCIFTS